MTESTKWVDKYNPKTFDDIVGNKNIVDRIKANISNLPDLLFYGRAGIGKTTLAEVIINILQTDALRLNASDERGIAVIQGRVKDFAKTQGLSNKIKIVSLDEADNLTKDAQDALKRTMELYSTNCRFILTANNKQKLIEPILSRCGGGMEFQPISKEDIKTRVYYILRAEGCSMTDDAFNASFEDCHGDLRQIINNLQTISGLTKNIELKHVKDIQVNLNYIQVFKLIQENKFTDACKIITKDDVVNLYRVLMMSDISNQNKLELAKIFALYDYRRQFAVMDFIQLNALIAEIINCLDNSPPKQEVNTLDGLKQKYGF